MKALPSPRLGTLVLVATVVTAALGLLLSAIQLDNVLDGRVRDRTPLGLTLMALGFLGPVIALIAIRRRHILRLKGLREWASLILFPGLIPLLWIAALLAYWTLGTVGRPVLPHTTGLVIRFDAEGRPTLHGEGELGFRDSTGLYIHPDEFGEGAIEFTGSATRADGGRVEVRGVLVLGTKARLRVEGLTDAKLVIDDRLREFPILLEPGTYRIVVSGSLSQ